jgi:aspartyl-tRNA(Asn)/glutamyl-tRNA(Gln) amidotransferase subunit A
MFAEATRTRTRSDDARRNTPAEIEADDFTVFDAARHPRRSVRAAIQNPCHAKRDPIVMRTLTELSRALAAGATSSEALAEEVLARAADPAGEGRRVFIALEPKKVLAQARASDMLRKAGIVPSPLAGLPVSVKDLFDVAGETTTAGSVVLRDAPPAAADAPAIARLRAAGAVLVGRTNLTEFAYSGIGINPHYDTPRNPYDRATGRIPGGSTAGGAVSVTDGMAVIGLGTDTGGSTRIPAALCGIVGYKPTKSRIPTDQVFPLSYSLDSIGPMGPSVACAAICDAVLAGQPAVAPAPAALAGLRLALPQTVVLDELDTEVARDFGRALERLSAAGAKLIEIPLAQFAEMAEINKPGGLSPMEAYFVHRTLLERDGERYDQRVRWRIRGGAKASAVDYLWTLERRRDWMARVSADIAPYDAVIMPTVPGIAAPIAPIIADEELYRRTNFRMLRNTSLINFLDGCALSLPMHAPGSAPTGLMLCGLNGQDARILSIGAAVEAALAY